MNHAARLFSKDAEVLGAEARMMVQPDLGATQDGGAFVMALEALRCAVYAQTEIMIEIRDALRKACVHCRKGEQHGET